MCNQAAKFLLVYRGLYYPWRFYWGRNCFMLLASTIWRKRKMHKMVIREALISFEHRKILSLNGFFKQLNLRSWRSKVWWFEDRILELSREVYSRRLGRSTIDDQRLIHVFSDSYWKHHLRCWRIQQSKGSFFSNYWVLLRWCLGRAED